jgi:hypothetical protein
MKLIKDALMLLGIVALVALIDALRTKGPAEKVGEQVDQGFRHMGRSLHETS